MLKIKTITKRFGSFVAVNNFSLEINQPGLYLFVGDNGSGKTTLFNLIAGFIHPDKGEISLNNSFDSDIRRKQLGISNEPFATGPSLTVSEIAEITQRIKRVPFEEMKELLKRWEIWSARGKAFKALSTGMKKRLSLAVSMPGKPDYLLWDEPFSGLDPLGIILLNQVIRELVEQQKTILLSTHVLNEINILPVSAYILKEGKLSATVHRNSTAKFNETILDLLKNK